MAYEAIFHPEKDLIIRIKHPRLKKIRNEYRKLLLKLVKAKKIELIELDNETLELKQANLISEDGYFKLTNPIQQMRGNLRNALFKSIVFCHTCGDLEGDRVFRNKDSTWYCPKCYKIIEKSDRKDFEALTRLH